MKKVLLVYLPFCTPASPPLSLTYLHAFLRENCEHVIEVLDLNVEFHVLKFPEWQKYYHEMQWDDYDKKTKEYDSRSKQVYKENNHKVVDGKKPEFFDVLLKKIRDAAPDVVAFSIVYSSQAFYAYALLNELRGITTVLGGPAVNARLSALATYTLKNDVEFLEVLRGEKIDHAALNVNVVPDFSVYDFGKYFTPAPVVPLRTSTTCYYKGCTFCAHYRKTSYAESSLEEVELIIKKAGQKYVFLIDDMIPVRRLLRLAEVFKKLDVKWACQLRPTKEFTFEVLSPLRDSGLVFVMWGVESGCDRILQLMNKGTNVRDVAQVLADAHRAGIKNVTYVMFGFPTETREEFMMTVDFLKAHVADIDLLSLSTFGLQRGTPIHQNPVAFGISRVVETERLVLEPKIEYEVVSGLSHEEVKKLKHRYQRTFERMDKFPHMMNFFREHMLVFADKKG